MTTKTLLDLPTWLLATIVIAGFGLLSVGITGVGRLITAGHRKEDHNETLGLLFAAGGVLYAVLLAFVVLAVWEAFSTAERTVNDEAATLVSLYIGAQALSPPVRSEARTAIRDYTRSVTDDEFPSMDTQHGSNLTQQDLLHLYEVYLQQPTANLLDATLASTAVQGIDQVTLLRNERLQASRSSLPNVFWIVLLVGAVLTLVMAAPIFMTHGRYHLASSFLLGASIGAVLLLVLVLDRPFTGDVSIKADAFEQNLTTYAAIDSLSAVPVIAPAVQSP